MHIPHSSSDSTERNKVPSRITAEEVNEILLKRKPASPSHSKYSVVVSKDGSTSIVGTEDREGGMDKAFIYVFSEDEWLLQCQLPGEPDWEFFVSSASISDDGRTLIIRAFSWETAADKVLIYGKSDSTWALQADLHPSPDNYSQFGVSVSMSGDGNTAIAGTWGWNGSRGKALIYIRSGSTWILQADLPHSLGDGSYFGHAVSLSADGNTAIVGAFSWNNYTGKALVYTRSGSTWSLQADLPHSLGSGSLFGSAVSISPDGSIADVEAYGVRKVVVYVRSGTTWNEQPSSL